MVIKFFYGKDAYVNDDAIETLVNYIFDGTRELPESERILGAVGVSSNGRKDIIRKMMNMQEIFRSYTVYTISQRTTIYIYA